MSLQVQYARPRRLTDALDLLDSLSSGATIVAGGQELMPSVNYSRLFPSVIVDINALPELQGLTEANGRFGIGALMTHRDLQTHPRITAAAPLLAAAAAQMGGGRQVHNRGTVGGNIASFHPLYDLLPALLAMDAIAEVHSASGLKEIALRSLVRDTQHGLGSRALLARVWITPQDASCWAYEKLKFTEGSYGSANAAVVLALRQQRVESFAIVVGAVSEQALLVTAQPSQPLTGVVPDSEWIRAVLAQLTSQCKQPLDDQQGHAEYRRAMVGVIAERAIHAALARNR